VCALREDYSTGGLLLFDANLIKIRQASGAPNLNWTRDPELIGHGLTRSIPLDIGFIHPELFQQYVHLYNILLMWLNVLSIQLVCSD